MANCPVCGSYHIQIVVKSNVSWSHKILISGLLEQMGYKRDYTYSKYKHVNICSYCGTTWEPDELYTVIEGIAYLTHKRVDLSIYEDRKYMQNFINELEPVFEEANSLKSSNYSRTGALHAKKSENTINGCLFGCTVPIVGLFMAGQVLNGWWLVLAIFLFPLLGYIFGRIIDNANKKHINEEIEKLDNEHEHRELAIELDVKKMLKSKIDAFNAKYK